VHVQEYFWLDFLLEFFRLRLLVSISSSLLLLGLSSFEVMKIERKRIADFGSRFQYRYYRVDCKALRKHLHWNGRSTIYTGELTMSSMSPLNLMTLICFAFKMHMTYPKLMQLSSMCHLLSWPFPIKLSWKVSKRLTRHLKSLPYLKKFSSMN